MSEEPTVLVPASTFLRLARLFKELPKEEVDREELRELREQVEKLTKERNAFQDQCIRLKNERAVENGQLAALAEQNENMRETLQELYELLPVGVGIAALSLPDLATPVLNQIKAEAYREAAGIVGPEDSYQDGWFKAKADSCAKLRAKADELEKNNG